MDSTSFDLPPLPSPPPPTTTVPFTLEHAADYNNHHHAATTHPPYAEMIYKAIEALKEKDGSSKRAIGKYIEQVYSEVLPPQHNTMLTQHLNHLKSAGLLIMFKKSYKLPSSLPPPPTIPRSLSESHLPFTPITQRGRGRPPKPIPPSLNDPAPDFDKLDVPPTFPLKRGRGRPPGTSRSRSLNRPARPPKPKSVSNGLKRRPGRPPKIQSQPTLIPFASVPFPSHPQEDDPTLGSPRPRGRPKRYADEVVLTTAAPSALSVVNAPPMRRGRPPKLPVIGKPKNSTGRPVGRPKGAKAAKKFADEDLRRKFEYFQSKVKESLEVLKPYFGNESPVTAIAAIQELEMLTTLNLEAPLRDETLQLQQFPEQILPQQQLPPPQLQAHMYEHQYLQIPSQSQVQQLFQPHTLDLS